MLRFLIPLAMMVAGAIGGLFAGAGKAPAPEAEAAEEQSTEAEEPRAEVPPEGLSYVDVGGQFVIPVIGDAGVRALVAIKLKIAVETAGSERAAAMVPKLRDAFLQVLLDHAATGGFGNAFLADDSLERLRYALDGAGLKLVGDDYARVLIVDVVRQDV